MNPWQTPALTGYSFGAFLSWTTWRCLLLRKEERRPNIWHEIPWLKLVKTNMPNPIKILGYIKCYSLSSHRPVKSPSNSIRYNCQKICSWLRRPKTILEITKKATLLLMVNNPIIYLSFSKTLLTTEKKLTEQQFLAYLSPIFLNTGTTNETFDQSGKQNSLRHILESSATMYKSSHS